MKHSRGCLSPATVLYLVLAVIGLASCSSNGKQWNPDDYTVKSGDTIYSIAWRYELDPAQFAAWNNLRVSSRLKPGNRLHTRKPQNFTSSSRTSSSNASHAARSGGSSATDYTGKKWIKVQKGDSLYLISKRTGVSINRLAQLNQLKKPYVIHPGQTLFLKPLPSSGSSTATSKYKKSGSQKTTSKNTSSQSVNWAKTVHWKRPADGKVVKKFNSRRNDAKGIDIKGKYGQTIVSSASGQVVYSGNGLISYGKLIIVKHNNTYLSAYAYNSKLLVKEGDVVKAGQKIAQMGNKDNLGARLHFEIRKHGKPVDPLKYLPW